jgi:predicted nucleic acid-binding protein
MNDKSFFDTNIILYSYSEIPEPKMDIAKNLISNSIGIISTQVLQEICNILIKKFKFDEVSILKTLLEVNDNFIVEINNPETINRALSIHFKYGFAYYDSLIIASALQNECSVLYSEDLQLKQKNRKIFNHH